LALQLQQELLATRRELETRSNQILSLEAALEARPELPVDAPESEKDKLIKKQSKTIRELEIVVRGYEDNLGEPLRAVREDVEKEWVDKFDKEVKLREQKEEWAAELVRQLEKEKKVCWLLECGGDFYLVADCVASRIDEDQVGGRTPSVSGVREQVRFAWTWGSDVFEKEIAHADSRWSRRCICRTTAEQGEQRLGSRFACEDRNEPH
jgi:hypothetical protein